jgi:hypothetical protein
MKAEQFYSGSSANLYTITARNGDILIIELGVIWKKAIKAIGYAAGLKAVCGALISHAHL